MIETPAYDLEIFIDPACPFCWLTSRWVEEVRAQRDYRVRWRWISLRMVNEARERDGAHYDEQYKAGHTLTLRGLRVLDAVRETHGNEAAGAAYTAFGNAIHVAGRRDEIASDPEGFYAAALRASGFDEAEAAKLAAHLDDESHDEVIRAEGDTALDRTGGDVGTPVLTFGPDSDQPRSFFGPVISKSPRGEDAVRLWDAVETLAASGVAEIKRSLRDPLDFT
jgi:2-hydroxychromene-2-carboxylate isomerase